MTPPHDNSDLDALFEENTQAINRAARNGDTVSIQAIAATVLCSIQTSLIRIARHLEASQ